MTAPESVAETREVDLLPCPFCGGEATIINGPPGCTYIMCKSCYAASDDGSEDRITRAWNTRTPVPTAAHYAALKDERDRLRDALRRYGNHSQLCASRGEYVYTDARTRHRQPCDCGYIAALEQSK